jgi:hypothetical protein
VYPVWVILSFLQVWAELVLYPLRLSNGVETYSDGEAKISGVLWDEGSKRFAALRLSDMHTRRKQFDSMAYLENLVNLVLRYIPYRLVTVRPIPARGPDYSSDLTRLPVSVTALTTCAGQMTLPVAWKKAAAWRGTPIAQASIPAVASALEAQQCRPSSGDLEAMHMLIESPILCCLPTTSNIRYSSTF